MGMLVGAPPHPPPRLDRRTHDSVERQDNMLVDCNLAVSFDKVVVGPRLGKRAASGLAHAMVFERRHLGLATLQFKVVATCQMMALEAGGADKYKRMRWQVRFWVSDQGVAAGIAHVPDLFGDDFKVWTRTND